MRVKGSCFRLTPQLQCTLNTFPHTYAFFFFTVFEYGGLDLSGASNILFFNGDLDPWKSGGILSNSSSYGTDIIAFLQRGAAHHLDLRTPNPLDPPDVVTARAMAAAAFKKWSNDFALKKGTTLLFSLS